MLSNALKKKIAWSTGVQFFGKLIQIGISIVTLRLLTDALGTAEYGVYGKIMEYGLFFATVANLGIFGGIVRKLSEEPSNGKILMNAFLIRWATAFVFFSIALLYAVFIVKDPIFVTGVCFFLASLFLDYSSSVGQAALQANYQMGRSVFAVTLAKVVELGLVYLLYKANAPLPFYFLAPLLGSVFLTGFTLFFVRKQIKPVWEIDSLLIRTLFWGALPFGIINIINSLYFRFMPSLFANNVLSEEHFGSYSLLLTAVQTFAILSTFYMFSVLPALRQALAESHFKRANEIFRDSFVFLTGLGFCLVFFGWLLGPPLLILISGKDFIVPELWFMLPMLLIIGALSYLYDLVLITLFALGMELWQLKREFLPLLTSLLLSLIALGPWTEAWQIFIVLLAAIAAEGLIVFIGLRHLREKGLFQHPEI